MPKGHSLIGAFHAQLVKQGRSRPANVNGLVIKASTNDYLKVATLYVSGLTLGKLTPDMINNFTIEFAKILNVNPSLLKLEFKSGSLIIQISFDVEKPKSFEDDSFLANTSAVLRQLRDKDIRNIIDDSGTQLEITGTANIDYDRLEVNIDINLQQEAINRCGANELVNPLVGDTLNNAIHTLIGSSIVCINNKGLAAKICDFPETSIRSIFITQDSKYLIIPSNVFSNENVSPLGQTSLPFITDHSNKIYVIDIETGEIFINRTQIEFFSSGFGFNEFNNTLYYASAETATYSNIYKSTISFSNSNINSVPGPSALSTTGPNILFTDVNNGFLITSIRIFKVDINANTVTRIAGQDNSIANKGRWKNVSYPDPNYRWNNGTGLVYSPFKDAPKGVDAWFTYLSTSGYVDTTNNRLLVADRYSQRIRSIDLSGNDYAVTTLAGTTPVLYGEAINDNNNIFSDSLLNSLGQVGFWENGTNSMPKFNKQNSKYLESTFNEPRSIIIFNNNIFITEEGGTRMLSNGYVSDFTVLGRI